MKKPRASEALPPNSNPFGKFILEAKRRGRTQHTCYAKDLEQPYGGEITILEEAPEIGAVVVLSLSGICVKEHSALKLAKAVVAHIQSEE
jgi:hypothetical protein